MTIVIQIKTWCNIPSPCDFVNLDPLDFVVDLLFEQSFSVLELNVWKSFLCFSGILPVLDFENIVFSSHTNANDSCNKICNINTR